MRDLERQNRELEGVIENIREVQRRHNRVVRGWVEGREFGGTVGRIVRAFREGVTEGLTGADMAEFLKLDEVNNLGFQDKEKDEVITKINKMLD